MKAPTATMSGQQLLWTTGEPCRWQSRTAKNARDLSQSGSLQCSSSLSCLIHFLLSESPIRRLVSCHDPPYVDPLHLRQRSRRHDWHEAVRHFRDNGRYFSLLRYTQGTEARRRLHDTSKVMTSSKLIPYTILARPIEYVLHLRGVMFSLSTSTGSCRDHKAFLVSTLHMPPASENCGAD